VGVAGRWQDPATEHPGGRHLPAARGDAILDTEAQRPEADQHTDHKAEYARDDRPDPLHAKALLGNVDPAWTALARAPLRLRDRLACHRLACHRLVAALGGVAGVALGGLVVLGIGAVTVVRSRRGRSS
jgi:hypothetical protein